MAGNASPSPPRKERSEQLRHHQRDDSPFERFPQEHVQQPPRLFEQETPPQAATTNEEDEPASRNLKNNTPAFHQLVALSWVCTFSFGCFTFFQYVYPAIFAGNWQRWNKTDGGIYRPNSPPANWLMVIHMVFGVVLMAVGPMQLIPWIRRQWPHVHRWMGRVYILSAIGASTLALTWILIYRTSGEWIHRDVGNVFFGLAVLVSAVQSYRSIEKKDLALHKRWSWRLFAAVFGAAWYRIYSWPAFVFVVATSGRAALSNPTIAVNLSYYLLWLPWAVVEFWFSQRRRDQEERLRKDDAQKHDDEGLSSSSSWKPSESTLRMSFVVLLVLFVPILVVTWIPAILGLPSGYQSRLVVRFMGENHSSHQVLPL